MPISESELKRNTNTHLLAVADDTVADTLLRWRSQPDPREWWWLIIAHGGEKYTALRFQALARLITAHSITGSTRLADLPVERENPAAWDQPIPGVITPVTVEQPQIGPAQAQRMLQDTPLLIVLHNGQFQGILSGSFRTFTFNDKPLLDLLDEFVQAPDAPPLLPNPDEPPLLPPSDDLNAAED
jgi:hypothetical protein